MNDADGADGNDRSTEAAGMREHGASSLGSKDFARLAAAAVRGFPSNLTEQIKREPYAAIGIACAVGLGTGILLGSRLLRSVLSGAVSCAIVELGRAYLCQKGTYDAPPARSVRAS
jgi:hypothetical protein